MCNGEARGIDLEEAMAEAVAQLPSIARTYKPERASVVAVVKPAVWRHLERKFARELRGSTELACEEVPLGEVRADQGARRSSSAMQAWAAAAPERAGLLQALDSGRQLTAAQRALFAELRQELGAEVKTAGTWSAARAARYLGLPERTVRELCEAGAVDAVRERGWCVHRRAADKWRRHELAKHLQDGASVRAQLLREHRRAGKRRAWCCGRRARRGSRAVRPNTIAPSCTPPSPTAGPPRTLGATATHA